jgi:hypothetical protein
MLPPLKISSLNPQTKPIPIPKQLPPPENSRTLLSFYFRNKVFSLFYYGLGRDNIINFKTDEKNGIMKEKPIFFESSKNGLVREDIMNKLIKIGSTRSKFKHKDKVEVWKQPAVKKLLRGIRNIKKIILIFSVNFFAFG